MLEDDFVCAAVNSAVVRHYGYNVVECHCAVEAFAEIDRRRPLIALVTDIDLGPGPDGFDAARYARTVYPKLTVLYISACAIFRYATQKVYGSIFIEKPFAPEMIINALSCEGRLEVS